MISTCHDVMSMSISFPTCDPVDLKAALAPVGGKGGGQACFGLRRHDRTGYVDHVFEWENGRKWWVFTGCFNLRFSTGADTLKPRAFAQGAARGVGEEALETAAEAAKKFWAKLTGMAWVDPKDWLQESLNHSNR